LIVCLTDFLWSRCPWHRIRDRMKRHIDRPPSRPRSCSGCRPGPGSRTAQLSTRATDVAIRAQGRRTLLFVEAARTGDVVDFVDATGAAWAWQLGASLLAKVLPRRWDHSTGSPAGRASVHRSLSHLGSSWLRMSNTSRSISSVGGTPTRAELTRYRPPGRRARATSAMTAARSATGCSPDRHGLLDRGVGDGQVRGVGNRDDWTEPASRSLGHGW